MQTYGVLHELTAHHHHTIGLLIGGASRQTEAKKLSNGRSSMTNCSDYLS